MSTRSTVVFSLWPLFLDTPLHPQPLPLSVSKAIHLALCSWPSTSPCHFLFGPWPHPGRSQEVYTVESRNQKSRSGQLSSEWQLLGPLVWALPLCSALPQLSSSSGLRSRSLWGHSEDKNGPQAGIPGVSQEPSLPGWKPSLRLCSPLGSPRDAPALSSPHQPASASPLGPQPLVPALAIPPE